MIQNEYEQEGFVIDSDAKADWALKKIATEQKEYDRLKSLAEEEIAEIQSRFAYEKQRFDNSTNYLKGLLRNYFMTVEHKETKTQESYKLLNGSLVLKKATTKMVQDEKTLLEWLEKNNEDSFIETVKKPKWGEFKKNLTIVDGKAVNNETGEVVDCISVEDVPEEFNLKL